MPEITNLSIRINSSAMDAISALDQLASTIMRVKGSMRRFDASTVINSINQIKINASSAATALNRMAAAQERVNRAMGGFAGNNYSATMHRVERNTNAASDSIKNFMVVLSRAQTTMQRMNFGNSFSSRQPNITGQPLLTGQSQDYIITSFVDDADNVQDEMEHVESSTQSAKASLDSFFASLRNIANSDSFKRLRTGLSGIGSAASAIPTYLGKQLVDNTSKAVKGMGQFFSSIKRIAMYRLIRTALKNITQGIGDGIKHLYNWSKTADGTFAASMNRIATASQYMGNSFAAMVSPLINSLSPAIDFIADKFVDLFNLINQIISRLSGATSYTAAKKVAAQWDDASKKASGSAKSAADDIKRTILGFDEINKLNDASSSSGSSGSGSGSSTSGAGMFEKRTIDGAVSSFADQLKAAFEASKWDQLGELLGGKVNELVNSIPWTTAGTKVGYYINALFSTAYWTLDAINFTNIGGKVATFLNNAFAQIDFSKIGGLMVKKFTIVADTIIGFFTGFDWKQAAGKISEFVEGLWDEITKWFNSYNWSTLGSTIWEKIKSALSGFDLSGMAKSMMTALGTAIRSAIQLKVGFLSSFWSDVATFWNDNIAGDTFLETASNVLNAIGKGFANLGTWIFDNIINPFVTALTGDENWSDKLKDVAGKILDAIAKGFTDFTTWVDTNIIQPIVDALKKAKTLVLGIGATIVTKVKDLFDGIKAKWAKLKNKVVSFGASIATKAKDLWDGIKAKWDKLKNKVANFGVAISTKAKELWEVIKAQWDDLKNKVANFGVAISTKAKDLWDGIKGLWDQVTGKVAKFGVAIATKAKDLWDGLKSLWDQVTGKIAKFGVAISTKAKDLWDGIKAAWDDLKNKVANFGVAISTTAKELWEVIKAQWDDLKNKVANFGVAISTTAKELWEVIKAQWDDLKNKVANFGVAISTKAKDLWDGIKSLWDEHVKDKFVGISAKITTAISKIWSWLTGGWKTDVEDNPDKYLSISAKITTAISNLWKWLTGDWKKDIEDNPDKYLKISAAITTFVGDLWNSLRERWDSFVSGRWLGISIRLGESSDPYYGTGDQYTQKFYDENIAPIQAKLDNNPLKTDVEVNNPGWKLWNAVSDYWKQYSSEIGIDAKVNNPGWNLWNAVSQAWNTYKSTLFADAAVNNPYWNLWNAVSAAWNLYKGTLFADAKVNDPGWNLWDTVSKYWNKYHGTLGVDFAVNNTGWSLWNSVVSWWNSFSGTLSVGVRASGQFASGGYVTNSGRIGRFADGGYINAYAGGTSSAHGTMFLAGEAGPEIVGHVNGRTEVLNRSQLASTMYAAVRSAMSGVTLDANFYGADVSGSEADYDAMYQAMFDAFTDAMSGSVERDREKVSLLRQINEKNFSTEISTASIAKAHTRANRRAGATIIPVGT